MAAEIEGAGERHHADPGEERRADAAVAEGSEQDQEGEMLHRERRQQGQPAGGAQHEGIDIEAHHQSDDRQIGGARVRIDKGEVGRQRQAQRCPQDMGDDVHPRPPVDGGVTLQRPRDEPVEQRKYGCRLDAGHGGANSELGHGLARSRSYLGKVSNGNYRRRASTASATKGLSRRSWPKVESGPCPGTKVTSSPSGQSFPVIERISSAPSPRGKSLRPTEPRNSTSPTKASCDGA